MKGHHMSYFKKLTPALWAVALCLTPAAAADDPIGPAALSLNRASDYTAPTVPTNLSATALSQGQISLSWTRSTDAVGVTGYKIFRDKEIIASTADSFYTDKGLPPSHQFLYSVQAYDAAGNKSAQSTSVEPMTSVASATDSLILIPEADLYVDAANPETNYGSDPALLVGGCSDASLDPNAAFIRFNVALPYNALITDAKLVLKCINSGSNVSILRYVPTVDNQSWNESQISFNNEILGDTAETCTTLSRVSSGSTYTITVYSDALASGQLTFKLEGQYDGAAFSSREGTDKPVLKVYYSSIPAGALPIAPENLTATAISDSQINLTWSASTAEGPIVGYKVFRNGSEIAFTTGTTYEDIGLDKAVTYVYTVSALDQTGNNSARSKSDYALTFGSQAFEESAGQVAFEAENMMSSDFGRDTNNAIYDIANNYAGYTGAGFVVANAGATGAGAWYWTSAAELSYLVKFTTTGTYYIWERTYCATSGEITSYIGLNGSQVGSFFTQGEGTLNQWKWTKYATSISIPSAGNYMINIRRRSPGNRIDRIVLTTNSGYTPSGNGPAESPLVGDAVSPSVPASLSATPASATQINLAWNASTDNVGVTGYRVYRNGNIIATTTLTSYSNTGLAPSTQYTYTVSAYDAARNYSEQCAPVTGTTQAPATTSFRYYRFVVTSVPNAGITPKIKNMRIKVGGTSYPSDLTANSSPSPYVASSSGAVTNATEYKGFNSSGDDYVELSENSSQWLKIDLGSSVNPDSLVMSVSNVGNFKLEGSTDNSNWNLLLDKDQMGVWGKQTFYLP